MSKLRELDVVGEFISDGTSVFLGGFTLHRVPMALIRELARLRRTNLTVWSHIGGAGIEQLLTVGGVTAVRSSYVGLDILGFAPLFQDKVASGEVRYIEETEATLMFGMKATQYRLPSMPTRALVGSEIVTERDDLTEYDCPLSGERLVAVPPVAADVAFIHAQAADEHGNAAVYGTMGNDIEIAKVSRRVIVSAERIVSSEELLANPEQVSLPGHLVEAVVEAPAGAYPTSCLPYYRADYSWFLDYLDAVESGHLDEHVAAHIDVDEAAYRDRSASWRSTP
jgi:glutaconate CoA-transferase subunit A